MYADCCVFLFVGCLGSRLGMRSILIQVQLLAFLHVTMPLQYGHVDVSDVVWFVQKLAKPQPPVALRHSDTVEPIMALLKSVSRETSLLLCHLTNSIKQSGRR